MNIPVTKSYIPDIKIYQRYVSRAFKNEWLTNRGELVEELEQRIKEYLGFKGFMTATNNGTIPLQLALELFGNKGEVITTPFSYVATLSSIVWQDCIPVFVDIDPEYLTIDPSKIEIAITERTTCILATHVYGNPCDVIRLQQIAEKHNIKVIYDAAHCFGVEYCGESIFNYGDVSTTSFHATKVFHTAEGGAFFTNNSVFAKRLYSFHNFGHKSKTEFDGVGINGKMSELNAAMGLAVLDNFENIIDGRKMIFEYYINKLNFIKFKFFSIRSNTKWNYSYFPIILDTEDLLIQLVHELEKVGVVPRRYFFPSLNRLDYVSYTEMPISEDISSRILCLPLYFGLTFKDASIVVDVINKFTNLK